MLLGGILYSPYSLGAMALAAGVVWLAPQSWDWSRRLGGKKIIVVLALLVLSMAVLSMQSYNPFIYFNF
jgi:hypothetical protein